MCKLIEGKPISQSIRTEIIAEADSLKKRGIQPKLVTLLAGNDEASIVYAMSKGKTAEKLGILYDFIHFPTDISEEIIIEQIQSLNDDPTVHGIMLELPLPKHINKNRVIRAINPIKDVDGLHPVNVAAMVMGTPGIYPATPQSCIELLLRSGVSLSGKHVVVIGRGDTVGRPLASLLVHHDATVTICHSKTTDIKKHIDQADIVVSAVGRPKLITGNMVHENLILLDAGINSTDKGIVGDVDRDTVFDRVHAVTPVPGGVGALTTPLLFKNVLKAIHLQLCSEVTA